MRAWNVFLFDKFLTTVFFLPYCEAEDVYKELVNCEGYDKRIELQETR